MTNFLFHPVLIFILVLLTFIQLLIHFYEYFLIFWPSKRSPKFQEKIRLVGIVRWESIYYLLLVFWLIGLEISNRSIFSIFFVSLIFLFALFHWIGFIQLLLRQAQWIPITHEINRNSSVIELAAILQRKFQSKSFIFSRWMVLIVGFDLIEIGTLSVLFYGLVRI